jgi:hypothetical protein
MFRAPELVALQAQLLLIGGTDLFEDHPDAIEVGDLAADLRKLGSMKYDLNVFAAGVVAIEDPLEMTLAGAAGGAIGGSGMEGMAFEQGAA